MDDPESPQFGLQFPAIRGVMAGRPYFVSMCPMRLIPRIFLFDEEEAELPADLRSQRNLNKSRVPEIAEYMISNREDYVFSALTASVDGEIHFKPISAAGEASKLGTLFISMDAKYIINDGQHRRAAIEAAIKECPELGDESVAIVFFIDRGLERCQQMFADLNRYAVRTSTSIGLLYDHRDTVASVTRTAIGRSRLMQDLVEREKTSLSKRSRKLFTLSALHKGTQSLLSKMDIEENEASELAHEFWETLASVFPEWQLVANRSVTSGEVREQYIHPHGITLHAMGRLGNAAVLHKKKQWRTVIKRLKNVDWTRDAKSWEGRALVNGRLSKAHQHVVLTTNYLKLQVGLELTDEERALEEDRKGSTLVS